MSQANSKLITSASKRSWREQFSPQPDLSDVVQGWSERLLITIIKQHIEKAESKPQSKVFEVMGMLQPFSARELKVKPEGDRSWQWWMLHTVSTIEMKPNDFVQIDSTPYKVMSDEPYFRNGYYLYELIETFRDGRFRTRGN